MFFLLIKYYTLLIKEYLNRCLASVVGNHKVHGNVFTVHVFVNPVPDVRRHHVCKQVTEILWRGKKMEISHNTAR